VQATQLGAGLDADFSHQQVARAAVGPERLRLPAEPVERKHAHAVEPLAQQLLSDQRLRFAHHLGGAARFEVLLEGELDGVEAGLLEAADLKRGERLGGDVVERRPAPQRERLARRAVGDQALEAMGVDLALPEPQLVAVAAGDNLGAVAAGAQRLAQLRDVDLDHLVRRRWRGLAPEAIDQCLRRDRGAFVEGEYCEQRARLASADGDRLFVDGGLHRSKNV
jgi:hypothetical protein